MAIREYKCSCGFCTEVILPIKQDVPPTTPCGRCGKDATWVQYSQVNLGLSTFQEAPIDIKIGHVADKKWQMYSERQDHRNKIRKQTGSLGLSAISDTFAPITQEQKDQRERAVDARANGVPADPEMV